MTYSNWDYAKRRLDPLPAGYNANTEHHSIISGVLDVADNVYISCGLGVIQRGVGAGNIRRFNLPSAAGDAVIFAGVLQFDASNYRTPLQPDRSHGNKDMINVMREGGMRVLLAAPITDVNAPVYCVHTTSGAELPGMFKPTQGTNSFLVKNAKWGCDSNTPTVATLELLAATNPA